MDCHSLAQFQEEQEDIATMQDLNIILLRNILPAHVATYFLDFGNDPGVLYHEKHEFVSVMFASIPGFSEFWKDKDKLECLRLLNEIIGDFDKLLSKPKFSYVEKIKTVGSTYMAAAGLQPSRSNQKYDAQRLVITMIDFAVAMIAALDQINQHAFQNFKLRIGISSGPVIAGVIGATKPQYDIWGNTVNLASRMDSHGAVRKIHLRYIYVWAPRQYVAAQYVADNKEQTLNSSDNR